MSLGTMHKYGHICTDLDMHHASYRIDDSLTTYISFLYLLQNTVHLPLQIQQIQIIVFVNFMYCVSVYHLHCFRQMTSRNSSLNGNNGNMLTVFSCLLSNYIKKASFLVILLIARQRF